jgi:hypothetical protein
MNGVKYQERVYGRELVKHVLTALLSLIDFFSASIIVFALHLGITWDVSLDSRGYSPCKFKREILILTN